ncbi:MAG: OmpA family protein [Candidatus Goldbacteria bacterium]|nr:OmpA family protein [Candidatus Goldiibacteriota bacterium]
MKKIYKIILVFIFLIIERNLISNEIKDDIFKSIGARASGMGGAFTSVADDYSSFFWNPAGLVNINQINASIFFDSAFSGKQNLYGINYIQPLFSDMTVSVSYLKTLYTDSNFINDFVYLSFATFLHEQRYTSFGINLKLLNFTMANYEFNGFTTAFDAGFIFYPDFLDKKMRFSLVATDLDARIKWTNGIIEKIPVSYKAGASFLFDNTGIAAFDLVITNVDYENKIFRTGFSLGGEKYFLNNKFGDVGFRTGLLYMENFNLSFGLSYKRKEFTLNYVFIPGFNNQGQTHKLDFTYFIGEETRKEHKKEIIQEIKTTDIELLNQTLKSMEFSLSYKYISPNNDDIYDTTELILRNSPLKIPGCKWEIIITDKDEKVVKEIKGIEVIQPKIIWDGKDNDGKNVKDGDYTIKYSFFVNEKTIWEKKRVITVDTTPPLFKLSIYPKIFAPVKNSKFNKLQINMDFKDKDINTWNISIFNNKNNVIRKISGEGITDKTYWNGDDALGNVVADGNYQIKLSANDFAGNVFEQIENVTIDTFVSNFNLTPDKRMLNVGKEKVNFLSNKKDANKIKKFDIIIFDDNKNLIKTLKNLSSINYIVSWDGTNEKNEYVRKGSLYFIKINIEQINGIEIETDYIIQTKAPDFEGIGIQLILAAIDFEEKSFEIPVDEYAYLNQAAEAVSKYAKNYFLILKGYASDFEEPEKNLELSIKRVKAVYDYLTTVRKINPENIYLTSYGDGNLIEGVSRETIQKAGKRVEVELLTK